MKIRLSLILLLLALPCSDLLAWKGGPWSNNSSLPGGTTGRYQAVMRGNNFIGLIEFSYNPIPPVNDNVVSEGSVVGFYNGFVYLSTTGAFVDEGNRSVTGIVLPDPGNTLSHGTMEGWFEAKVTSTTAAFTFRGNGEMTVEVDQEPTDPTDPTSPTISIYELVEFSISGGRVSTQLFGTSTSSGTTAGGGASAG